MEVIKEKLDKDYFIDIVLADKEIGQLMAGEMLSIEFWMDKNPVYLGLRKKLKGEENATQERKK